MSFLFKTRKQRSMTDYLDDDTRSPGSPRIGWTSVSAGGGILPARRASWEKRAGFGPRTRLFVRRRARELVIAAFILLCCAFLPSSSNEKDLPWPSSLQQPRRSTRWRILQETWTSLKRAHRVPAKWWLMIVGLIMIGSVLTSTIFEVLLEEEKISSASTSSKSREDQTAPVNLASQGTLRKRATHSAAGVFVRSDE